MVNRLSNKEEMLRNYIKEKTKAEFPGVDVRDNGAFMEMFGMPHVKLLMPLIDFADKVKLMQSLENAAQIPEEDMDRLAAKDNVYRNMGEKARGFVSFFFNDIPKSGIITIPEAAEVRSKQGLTFITTVTRMFTEEDLVDLYDPETFRYKITVEIEAEATGTEYNVEEGDISNSGTDLPFLDGVLNETKIIGGKNKETNVELARRVKEYIAAPNLGNVRGYNRYLKGFDGVEETLVVGYNHPLMKRDIIGQYRPDGPFVQTVRDVHWGQKVDLYIRGADLEEVEENVEVAFDEKRGRFQAFLTDKPVWDVISVKLYDPFGNNDDPDVNQSRLYVNNFHLEKDENFETIGTLEEKAYVVMEHEELQKGSLVQIRYRKNKLIEMIDTHMNQHEERPPCADVKVKEANKKFVFGGIVVRLKTGIGLREKDKNLMYRQAFDAVKTMRMGDEIQYSDVLSPFVDTINIGVDETEQIVDYIHLPTQFLVLENNNKYIFHCLDEKRRFIIQAVTSLSAPLKEIITRYKDAVTVNDFFDSMHLFTYEHNINDLLTLIEQEELTDESIPVKQVRQTKELINHGRIVERLSPATTPIQENEYFELADLNVYEHVQYTMDEIKQMLWTVQNIANGPVQRDEEGNIITDIDLESKGKKWIEYAVFISIITFVSTLPKENIMMNFLIDYLRELTVDKEIDLKL